MDTDSAMARVESYVGLYLSIFITLAHFTYAQTSIVNGRQTRTVYQRSFTTAPNFLLYVKMSTVGIFWMIVVEVN